MRYCGMKLQPFKIKSEIIFAPCKKGTAIEAKMFFVCDPERNTECNKILCGECCKSTTNIKFAKRFGVFDE